MTTLASARWMLLCRSDEDDHIKKYIECDRASIALTVAAMRLRIGAQLRGQLRPGAVICSVRALTANLAIRRAHRAGERRRRVW